MDYKELLDRCRTKPGWLGTGEQKECDARLKYRAWVDEIDAGNINAGKTGKKGKDPWSERMS